MAEDADISLFVERPQILSLRDQIMQEFHEDYPAWMINVVKFLYGCSPWGYYARQESEDPKDRRLMVRDNGLLAADVRYILKNDVDTFETMLNIFKKRVKYDKMMKEDENKPDRRVPYRALMYILIACRQFPAADLERLDKVFYTKQSEDTKMDKAILDLRDDYMLTKGVFARYRTFISSYPGGEVYYDWVLIFAKVIIPYLYRLQGKSYKDGYAEEIVTNTIYQTYLPLANWMEEQKEKAMSAWRRD